MNKVRSVVAGIIVLGLGTGLLATPAGVSAAPDPDRALKVRILSPDGKQRLKVKRKISYGLFCNKNCAVVVDTKLVFPDEVLKDRIKGGLKAFQPKGASLTLNAPALRYLKLTYPRTRFVVKVTATDVATGNKTVKRKTFRFRR